MTNELKPWRLNLLRCAYALVIIGLGLVIWPGVLDTGAMWEHNRGIVVAMLAAFSLLALIGLRHPLRMLPLLFWEITWKAIWLLRVALPMQLNGTLDERTAGTVMECALAVLIAIVIPWDYVWRTYVTGVGDPWRRA